MCKQPWRSAGGVELREQRVEVAQAFCPQGVAQGLVLREDVDEAFADLVTMLSKQLPPWFAERRDDFPDLAVGAEACVRDAVREQPARVVARLP